MSECVFFFFLLVFVPRERREIPPRPKGELPVHPRGAAVRASSSGLGRLRGGDSGTNSRRNAEILGLKNGVC